MALLTRAGNSSKPRLSDSQPRGRAGRAYQSRGGKGSGAGNQNDHAVYDGKLYAGEQPKYPHQPQIPDGHRHADLEADGNGDVAEDRENVVAQRRSSKRSEDPATKEGAPQAGQA